jgi:hypothetical protein
MKKISIKEFRESGYLQELNRQFLHPLGLALEITMGNDKEEFISGVWDSREDPEGIHYNIENSEESRKETFRKKRDFILSEQMNKHKTRKDKLGFIIEPIN